MAMEQPDPHDDKVESVPLPADDADRVVAQENVGREASIGGGEWPSPKEPPTGPSPGDDAPSSAEAGDGGDDDAFPPMKESLAVDPVGGGSSSVPEDDEPGR